MVTIRYRRTPRQEVASRIFHMGHNDFYRHSRGITIQSAWEMAGESIWVTK